MDDRLNEVNGGRPIRQDLADQYNQQSSTWLDKHDEVELIYEGDLVEDDLDDVS